MIEQTRATASVFIGNELQRITAELERQIASGDFPTLDEQRALINKFEEDFFKALRNTHTGHIRFDQFEILNPVKQSKMIRYINWDISGAYNRLEDIQVELQTRVNKFFAFKRQVEDRVARANGVLQSTTVLNDIGVFEIGDSFSDLNRIDTEAASAEIPMFQSRNTGVVTLPREQVDTVEPQQVIIMDSSNGFIPADQDIEALNDNNSDTWFEYHREVVAENDSEKLTLDLLFKLKLPTVVNLIRIVPLILDNKAFPRIESIETSSDGRIYQPVRDSLPGFITKEEEDALYTLGPVGFRNQDAAEFIITPRVCQFIKIRIRQSKRTPQTDGTERQIIAIRDVIFEQVRYLERGELQTTPLPLPFLAKRVLVSQRAAQTDPLTTIAYQISLDGGASYNPLLVDTPLDINTGTPTSISVDGQKREARLRLTAVRDAESFNGVAAPLASTIDTLQESIPLGQAPIIFTLRTLPIQDTLRVFRPIATIGFKNKGTVLLTGGGQDNLTIDLPFEVKPFTETIKVNGHEWTRVASFSNSDPDATNYRIDYNERKLYFGDNTKGKVPESEVRIEVPAEKVVIPDTSPFTVDLKNSHDFNRQNIKVEWTGRATKVNQELLRRGATEHPFNNQYISKSVRVREQVPAGVSEFTLGYIPLDTGALEFDDTEVFAAWTATPVVSGQELSPVKIRPNPRQTTDDAYPGYVEYDAIARIVNKRSEVGEDGYSVELFKTRELEVYRPTFNSSAFTNEKTFINGKNELVKAGDYSIDYDKGIAYSFSETAIDGNTFVNYFYQPKRTLGWQFNDSSTQLVIEDDSVLVNKNDLETIVVEEDLVRYYVLFKDNRFIWLPFSDEYVLTARQRFNTKNLTADLRPKQDPDPVVDFSFVPSNDFIKGSVLPAGKTRVNLKHDQIVKNSVRFIHVSDDINSYNDRIVTKDSLNNITVAPKPVKDVYGNSLTGSTFGTTTQRDIDKTKLTREVQFINGRDELEFGGDYSIDYENGVLYTVDPIPAYTIIQYEYSNIGVAYIAHQELAEGSDFTVNPRNLEVTVNNLDQSIEVPNGTLLARYSVIENFSQDPAQVQRFYTPILYGYKLKVSKG